jgi:hypothetical protein
MPAPKKYRNTTPFLFNAELDRFNEFREICRKENKSVQEKLNELIVHEVETAGIGENNPLGITYGPPVQNKLTNYVENPLAILDLFINNGIIGLKQWQPVFAEVQDQEKMDRYVNLTDIMYITAKNRQSYLKTGKAVISTGKVQTLPTMKGTRSGF